MFIQVQVFAGHSITRDDEREPTTVQHDELSPKELGEVLRHIGLEYNNADYFPTRQVVITISPVTGVTPEVRQRIRAASRLLEETGQL